VSTGLVEEALQHIRRTSLKITPRKVLPCGLDIDVNLRQHQIETGRALTRWGDPGLASLVESGKYREGRIDDRLVDAVVELVKRWGPTPRPT